MNRLIRPTTRRATEDGSGTTVGAGSTALANDGPAGGAGRSVGGAFVVKPMRTEVASMAMPELVKVKVVAE